MLLQTHHPTHLILASAALLAAVSMSVTAQVVLPRQVAALSIQQPFAATWETAIAAPPAGSSGTQAMAVYHVQVDSTFWIGYALAQFQAGGWVWTQEGIINEGQSGLGRLADASVAYDSVAGRFVVSALNIIPDTDSRQIVTALWDGDSFDPWVERTTLMLGDDKPSIVAGEMSPAAGRAPTIREFYIAWRLDGVQLGCLRSPNGGQSWIGGPALYEDNSFVTIKHWPLPRVHGNRPLYVGFLDNISESSAWIGFVRGNDISGGQVRFRRLVVNVLNQPLLINLNRNRSGAQVDDIVPLLPGGSGVLGGTVGAGVDMAVDPTDANRLYVVAHDTETATAGDIDVNIYLWKLTRDDPIGLPNVWTVHPRVLVADDDDLGNETDQFMPAIVVDALGVVHVIFYSDRGLVQDDGAATQQPQFDVWYAFSVNQGSSFPNQQELFSIPPSRAVDFAQPATNFALRDYIGIAAGADRVLTSFMGRNALDTGNPNKSLIWSSQITRQ